MLFCVDAKPKGLVDLGTLLHHQGISVWLLLLILLLTGARDVTTNDSPQFKLVRDHRGDYFYLPKPTQNECKKFNADYQRGDDNCSCRSKMFLTTDDKDNKQPPQCQILSGL